MLSKFVDRYGKYKGFKGVNEENKKSLKLFLDIFVRKRI